MLCNYIYICLILCKTHSVYINQGSDALKVIHWPPMQCRYWHIQSPSLVINKIRKFWCVENTMLKYNIKLKVSSTSHNHPVIESKVEVPPASFSHKKCGLLPSPWPSTYRQEWPKTIHKGKSYNTKANHANNFSYISSSWQ